MTFSATLEQSHQRYSTMFSKAPRLAKPIPSCAPDVVYDTGAVGPKANLTSAVQLSPIRYVAFTLSIPLLLVLQASFNWERSRHCLLAAHSHCIDGVPFPW